MAIGTYISIITLSVNGLNASTKKYRLAEWVQKEGPYYAFHERPTSALRTIQTESEDMEKDIPCKWKSKECWSSNIHIR